MTGVRKTTLRVAEFIKERVTHSIDCRETLGRGVFEECGNELDCVVGCFAEDLPHRKRRVDCDAGWEFTVLNEEPTF